MAFATVLRSILKVFIKSLKYIALLALIGPPLVVVCLRWISPPTSAFMIQRAFKARQTNKPLTIAYQWVDWDKISPHLFIAVVTSEDQKFPDHNGFDFESIEDAWEDRVNGVRSRGASTISQQVAKNLFLWGGKSFIRKGIEAYFTVLIEFFWSKRRILEVYVNIAEFGNGVYGVGAASERFFKKAPAALTTEEASLLAAVLPSPRRLYADRPSPYLRERSMWIRTHMAGLGGPSYLSSILKKNEKPKSQPTKK